MFAKIKTFRKYSTKKVDSVKYFYFPQNYNPQIPLSSICKGNVSFLTIILIYQINYNLNHYIFLFRATFGNHQSESD